MAYLDTLAKKRIGVLGLGISGLACVSFLMKFRIKPFVMDGNPDSAGLRAVRSGWPDIAVHEQFPQDIDLLIVSPGIALKSPLLQEAEERGIEIIGDIELFARINSKPVIAITGSNGKSTVTKLVTQILKNAGLHAVMGGNIGVPVLKLLSSPFDVAVLELSSFQLETTYSLNCISAVVLNVVEDHMDRYDSFDDYVDAKQRIFNRTEFAVYSREDELTQPVKSVNNTSTIGLDEPAKNHYGIRDKHFCHGTQIICPIEAMKLLGRHNQINALAAIALVEPFSVTPEVIEKTLNLYLGLPHRCELVCEDGGIRWVNDSKATNVGATIAALQGIAPQCKGKLILIAGGLAKGQDFSPLRAVFAQYVDELIVIGTDGGQIAALMADSHVEASLEAAVKKSKALASAGDMVLLSPACASQDMFGNFEERGDQFSHWAREVSRVG